MSVLRLTKSSAVRVVCWTMSKGTHARLRLTADSEDPVWRWFVLNGPHGEHFTWHSELGFTPRGIESLSRFVGELTEKDPEFPAKVRGVALQALDMDELTMKRRAIQVLCVVGTDEDLEQIKPLRDHPDAEVAKDARTCLFERGVKGR